MMYEYWLAKVPGIPAKKKQKLQEYYGNGKAIYYIEETQLRASGILNQNETQILLSAKKETDLENRYRDLEKEETEIVLWNSLKYPEKLKNIPSAPYALYVKGKLPNKDCLTVAIVGARKCTVYGETFAMEYGQELARAGIQIVSGMARGVDGYGQRGALNSRGKTYAVLGCGTDICYPKEHMGLYKDILACGGVISEYAPGTPPLPMHFPARNRIISGLSDVVLVIEAKEKSGSLITADMALEQGKDVYALPGPVTSPLSAGCHSLISQGAGILISPSELLKDLGVYHNKLGQNSDKNKKELETPENIVYSCLDLYPKGLETLVMETGLEPGQIMRDLISLELEGKVKEISKNHYIRK